MSIQVCEGRMRLGGQQIAGSIFRYKKRNNVPNTSSDGGRAIIMIAARSKIQISRMGIPDLPIYRFIVNLRGSRSITIPGVVGSRNTGITGFYQRQIYCTVFDTNRSHSSCRSSGS